MPGGRRLVPAALARLLVRVGAANWPGLPSSRLRARRLSERWAAETAMLARRVEARAGR